MLLYVVELKLCLSSITLHNIQFFLKIFQIFDFQFIENIIEKLYEFFNIDSQFHCNL